MFEDCEGREIRLTKLMDKLLLERAFTGIGLALAAETEMLPFLAPGRESSLKDGGPGPILVMSINPILIKARFGIIDAGLAVNSRNSFGGRGPRQGPCTNMIALGPPKPDLRAFKSQVIIPQKSNSFIGVRATQMF